MADKKGKNTPVADRTIFDQKCITCGTWMQRTVKVGRNGIGSFTYSCPECGLSYTVDE
jgi:predicted RNA-binding Zn-ribbon protein involved in translation (DUF1610 family)